MTKITVHRMMDSSSDEGSDTETTQGATGTSTNKNGETNIPQLKPQMDSIFSEVEKSLPSIDFDLSDVGSDADEPIIFHRNLKTSDYLYDDDKDLDTSLTVDSFPETFHTSTSQLDTNILSELSPLDFNNGMCFEKSESASSWVDLLTDAEKDKKREKNRPPSPKHQNWINFESVAENVSHASIGTSVDEGFLMDKRIIDETLSQTTRGTTTDIFEKSNKTPCSTEINQGEKKMKKKFEKEKHRKKEKEIVSKMLSPNAPTLSLHALGNINLDVLLDTLNEDNQYGPPTTKTAWSDEHLTSSNIGDGDTSGVKGQENMTLIQKLAQLSVSQGGMVLDSIDPRTGARQRQAEPQLPVVEIEKYATESKQKESLKKKTTASMGTNTRNHPRLSPPTLGGTKRIEPDTVFIDLRGFEKHQQEQQQSIQSVQRILGIKPESSDSSDSEDETELWEEQRRRIKQSLTSRCVSTEPFSSKPRLSQAAEHRQPQRVINLNKPQTASVGTSVAMNGISQQEKDKESEQRQQSEIEAQCEKERKMEIARKAREQKEKERESRIRLGKRIEAVQPLASVSGQQPCAEATPVLYDIDASYEPAPCSLPSVMSPDRECILLTVNMSSNGQIVLHRNKANKSVDTGCGLSASYTTLLTWLLSLVPHNFSFLQEATSIVAKDVMFFQPFSVVGLQQMWLDEHLCLTIAITPAENFNTKFAPVKKSKIKGTSPFVQHIIKYLSSNTLHSVCPWLQGLVSMEVHSAKESCPYVYKPPLPNITTKPLSTFIQVNPDPKSSEKILNTSVGFFWQSVDSNDGYYENYLSDENINYETQNTMSLIYKKIFHDPSALMGIFNRVLQEGLDLCGIRMLYPTPELLNTKHSDNKEEESDIDLLNNIGPVLAIALRGTFARSIWLDAVGPSDPVLARRTDPMSLCAQFGGSSRDECLLFCPRNPARVNTELTRWFGGRVPPGGCIEVGTPYTRKDNLHCGIPKGRRGKKVASTDSKDELDDLPSLRPPATLTATTTSYIFLTLSPLLPTCTIGLLMATCQRRGYQLRGIKRLKLGMKKAEHIGIDTSEISTFTQEGPFGEKTEAHQGRQLESSSPATIFLLQKENSSHNAASLVESFMIQLTLQGVMGSIQAKVDFPVLSSHLFHTATFNEGFISAVGGDFSKCPDFEMQPSYLEPVIHTSPELEQVAVLILLGHDILKSCGLFISKILNLMPHSKTPVTSPLTEGLELLGIKWLPSLSVSQAKDITPYEVGDIQWKASIHTLTSEPVMVLALRGIDVFRRLSLLVPRDDKMLHRAQSSVPDKIMSQTTNEAYTFVRLFFTSSELFSDAEARVLLPYLPELQASYYSNHGTVSSEIAKAKKPKLQTKHHLKSSTKECIFEMMLAGPQPITTFLLIKPTAVRKHLSKLVKKIAQEGFGIVGLRLEVLDQQAALMVIPAYIKQDDRLCQQHLSHLTSGPSLCLCLQRENAVKKLIDVLGPHDPQSARRHSPFLWRGVFGSDEIANGLHGSADYRQAVLEQKFFFPDGLCCPAADDLDIEGICCPGVDSMIDLCFHKMRDVCLNSSSHSLTDHMHDIHELLQQTICLVLTPPVVVVPAKGRQEGYVRIIDTLQVHGFELCGGRMVWFSKTQAEHFLHLVNAGSFKQVPLLTSGPCIVLALQRDNAVLAFDAILDETMTESSILQKYGDHIYRPSDIKQSNQLLSFFFDRLMPESHLEIVKKDHPSSSPKPT